MVFRAANSIKAEGVDSDDAVGQEKRDREIKQTTPNCHTEPDERFTQRRGRREFFGFGSSPNPRYLDEFVEKRPRCRILPNFRTCTCNFPWISAELFGTLFDSGSHYSMYAPCPLGIAPHYLSA